MEGSYFFSGIISVCKGKQWFRVRSVSTLMWQLGTCYYRSCGHGNLLRCDGNCLMMIGVKFITVVGEKKTASSWVRMGEGTFFRLLMEMGRVIFSLFQQICLSVFFFFILGLGGGK